MKTNEKLALLRKKMKKKGLDAYIIPSSDPHKSEYVTKRYESRKWLSGFTGSAGTLVVTAEESGLWTDGRYYIQAEEELSGSDIKLFKMMQPGVPSYTDWICSRLDSGSCVGFDSGVFSVDEVKRMNKKFSPSKIRINGEHDLLDEIWEDRPQLPTNEIFVHELKYAGLSPVQKLEKVRTKMSESGTDCYIMSSLHDIAWLFNLRGHDVKNNPVFMAYAIIEKEKAVLFVEKKKITESVKNHLDENGVEVKGYSKIEKAIKNIDGKNTVFFDPKKVSWRLYDILPKTCKALNGEDIVENMKAVKSESEIRNIRNCQVRDAVAMAKFLYWIDANVGKEEMSEISVSDKLEELRRQQELFVGTSFDTICAYKEHAAKMHYSASESSQYTLAKEGFLLVDSGGQYLDGTTDITRTIALGNLTDEQKRDFTLVLKGHIALANVKFLYGATGTNIDIIARQPMWKEGIDYKCGTGHGIGYFLSVHEGPQRISQIMNNTVLEEGMLLTNEPGIYREGSHGIRTENTLLVKRAQKTEFGQFMEFETISYCPIDIRAVEANMLSEDEKKWLNSYHKMVYDNIEVYLDEDEKKWLEDMTREI
ncbi:Xaa-Pro aminopeptidase [Peptoclostridium litorale DSM 5388]|uniref:Xaa-Pro dipeptidase PepQ n=1 Tax=Peptoclostridium litorale DSM 5388 TaxID=1121324 RepID=A0A069RDQ8_PEPLI|nr:aminopeptidase P family protein [Peptoclostridium litorale]KDR94893.1 Xaa-Pro dipeptidase PepQ [Peptoclostridium litorale DSM 5388]SIN95039.1 Xaa-Pro aminopeptidase [Peptoclostridium litorale DSM 5388]